eukprot:GHVS01050767.1.p1 GENE.GHVS01050767.1~~GHVS01050767.1.p1  ORF type:complete len:975 (+),score=234.43 GHVS01050767.1:91-3015(+)
MPPPPAISSSSPTPKPIPSSSPHYQSQPSSPDGAPLLPFPPPYPSTPAGGAGNGLGYPPPHSYFPNTAYFQPPPPPPMFVPNCSSLSAHSSTFGGSSAAHQLSAAPVSSSPCYCYRPPPTSDSSYAHFYHVSYYPPTSSNYHISPPYHGYPQFYHQHPPPCSSSSSRGGPPYRYPAESSPSYMPPSSSSLPPPSDSSFSHPAASSTFHSSLHSSSPSSSQQPAATIYKPTTHPPMQTNNRQPPPPPPSLPPSASSTHPYPPPSTGGPAFLTPEVSGNSSPQPSSPPYPTPPAVPPSSPHRIGSSHKHSVASHHPPPVYALHSPTAAGCVLPAGVVPPIPSHDQPLPPFPGSYPPHPPHHIPKPSSYLPFCSSAIHPPPPPLPADVADDMVRGFLRGYYHSFTACGDFRFKHSPGAESRYTIEADNNTEWAPGAENEQPREAPQDSKPLRGGQRSAGRQSRGGGVLCVKGPKVSPRYSGEARSIPSSLESYTGWNHEFDSLQWQFLAPCPFLLVLSVRGCLFTPARAPGGSAAIGHGVAESGRSSELVKSRITEEEPEDEVFGGDKDDGQRSDGEVGVPSGMHRCFCVDFGHTLIVELTQQRGYGAEAREGVEDCDLIVVHNELFFARGGQGGCCAIRNKRYGYKVEEVPVAAELRDVASKESVVDLTVIKSEGLPDGSMDGACAVYAAAQKQDGNDENKSPEEAVLDSSSWTPPTCSPSLGNESIAVLETKPSGEECAEMSTAAERPSTCSTAGESTSSSLSTVRGQPKACEEMKGKLYSSDSYAGRLLNCLKMGEELVNTEFRSDETAACAAVNGVAKTEEEGVWCGGNGGKYAGQKVVWVSEIPDDMDDLLIRRAVAHRLKQCDGHVIRVYRKSQYGSRKNNSDSSKSGAVKASCYGYIELDCWHSVDTLLKRGLYFRGKLVRVDYPNRFDGNNGEWKEGGGWKEGRGRGGRTGNSKQTSAGSAMGGGRAQT